MYIHHELRPVQALQNWHEGEEGQLSILSLVVIIGILCSLCMVLNCVHVIRQKLETQNAADAVTQAATTQMARGMNAVTTANHLIGEVQALVVLHHALGGNALDQSSRSDHTPQNVRSAVDDTYQLARAWCNGAPQYLYPRQGQYNSLRQAIHVEAAIGDSRTHLKQVTSHAYVAHAVGGFFFNYAGRLPYVGPYARALGIAIIAAARIFEEKTFLEWKILDLMELIAKTPLSPLKKGFRHIAIPLLYEYSKLQSTLTPIRMENAARETGQYHAAEGSLFPGLTKNWSLPLLHMPLVKEPQNIARQRLWRSQLVRSSVPWIHHWRQPMLELGERGLRLARFKSYYVHYTQEMALDLADEAKKSQGINLLILDGLNITTQNKGNESWSKAGGSREADRLFATIGFAYRPAPPLAAPAYFEDVNQDGVTAFAQGMIYNNNPQVRGSGTAELQAIVGWDTLNWTETQVPEWERGSDPNPDGNTPASYFKPRAPEPRIAVNWESLLVPATRIQDVVPWQRGALGRLMRRTAVTLPSARTH